MTIHLVGLLGTSDAADTRMATDAVAFHSFCRPITLNPGPEGAPSTFILLTARNLDDYDGFNQGAFAFMVGDYSTDKMALRPPFERSGLTKAIHPPTSLKIAFLERIAGHARTMQPEDHMCIALFAHVESDGGVVIGGGLGDTGSELLLPGEVNDALRTAGLSKSASVTIWAPNYCLGETWMSGDLLWTILEPTDNEPSNLAMATAGRQPTYSPIIKVAIKDNVCLLPVPWTRRNSTEGRAVHCSFDASEFGHDDAILVPPPKSYTSFFALLGTVDSREVRHPLRFLKRFAAEFVSLPSPPTPCRMNLLLCISDATDAADLDALGDKFGHQVECILTMYLFCTYGPWAVPKSDAVAALEDRPYRLASFLLAEAASMPHSVLDEFLAATNTNLGVLGTVSGVETSMHGAPLRCFDVLRWMAAQWVKVGRPPFDVAGIVIIRLWRFSNLHRNFTPLLRFLTEVNIWKADVSQLKVPLITFDYNHSFEYN